VRRAGPSSSASVFCWRPGVRESFVQGLRDFGYVEGRNLQLEARYADGKPERFPTLAAELLALKVDVIVTFGGSAAALAAKHATTTVPVIFTAVGDPVGAGIVNSLARPGGNVTGLSGMSRAALLLKPDAVPEHARKERIKTAQAAARSLGLQLHVAEARRPEDFDRAFADIVKGRADGLAYGPNMRDLARRSASYIDKIVKGARAGDLPVGQHHAAAVTGWGGPIR
jgi:putative ABC transport system substrate-binding protein